MRRFGSAHVQIRLDNQLGKSFRLVGAKIVMDGQPIYERSAADFSKQRQTTVYDGMLEAGEHDLSVGLELRGAGHGVFSYLKGYRFRAKKQHRFDVDADLPAVVRVIAHEQGDPTTPLEQRPTISVRLEPR